jgi:predicted DCC family thiol-disulfide oxidoreductase YuxK
MTPNLNKQEIILFDGYCNMCEWIVRFVMPRDPGGRFRFAALSSEVGQYLLNQKGVPADVNSFILIKGVHYMTHSTAALHVCKRLTGLWPILFGMMIIPKFLRDAVYRVIARNRYRWFGQKDVCMIAHPSYKKRFIESIAEIEEVK